MNGIDDPLYRSIPTLKSMGNEYRIYGDRIELKCRFPFFSKALVIRKDELISIGIIKPPVIRTMFWALKLDLADLNEHAEITRTNGFFRKLRFTPGKLGTVGLLKSALKSVLIVAMVFLASAVSGAGESSKIQIPPLGFHTLDLTKELWASIDDARRLKGSVAEVLPYEGIKRMIILRCNMHLPGEDYLDRFIRRRLTERVKFEAGPLPERNTRDLRSPLLTVLVETAKGDLGLLTIYSDAAFLELNGRFGLMMGE